MGQQLVISVNKYEYAEFKCIQSLQNVDWSNIDSLIFHSCKDTDVNTILELSKAGNIVKKMIYINEQINSLFYGIFAGMDADIFSDSTMLEDEEMLSFLVENYKNTGMTIKSPDSDLESISKFVATLSTQSAENLTKLINNRFMLNTLESATKNIETALVRTDESNTGMVEMFNKTSEIIATFQEGQMKTSEELEKLSNYLEEINKKQQSKGTGVINFSTYQVPNSVSKVLYIRVFSPCRFLFSFIETYQHYLKMTKQVSAKLLFAMPKLKQYITKYGTLPRLASETIGNRTLQSQPLFVTFEPKAPILQAFFNMDADMYIVVDMLFGDALLQGAKVMTLSAVNGLSDIKRFNVDSSKCIISHMGLSTNIVIPYISGYNFVAGPDGKNRVANQGNKRTKYFENCKSTSYLKLDNVLNL